MINSKFTQYSSEKKVLMQHQIQTDASSQLQIPTHMTESQLENLAQDYRQKVNKQNFEEGILTWTQYMKNYKQMKRWKRVQEALLQMCWQERRTLRKDAKKWIKLMKIVRVETGTQTDD